MIIRFKLRNRNIVSSSESYVSIIEYINNIIVRIYIFLKLRLALCLFTIIYNENLFCKFMRRIGLYILNYCLNLFIVVVCNN